MRIQIISIVGSLLFIFLILELIRRKKLKEAYALIWGVMSICFLILACWVDALGFVSKLIGIEYAPATLFLVLLVTVVLILIQFSVIISSQTDKIRSLSQETALLKQRLAELEKGSAKNKNK
ncbi:MAG: DUF2304 domain-containing protein [Victivallaceae bacterium]|nr:DUF2304 domain-containing protein [Victivallaceae bacterium]